MSVIGLGKDRQLLPRWQPSEIAIENGELASDLERPNRPLDHRHFDERKREWSATHSVDVAAELVGSSIVLGKTDEVQDAARYVLDNKWILSPVLQEMAAIAVGAKQTISEVPPVQKRGRIDFPRVYQEISELRSSLHKDPRDMLGNLDLARYYALIGQDEKAGKHIKMSLWLAPNNRYALRCAARFFAHIGDVSRSLKVLRVASATRTDPWLMAAEIAVAQLGGRSSQFASSATKALTQKMWNPRSQAELEGALASLHLRDGATQKAKKLFTSSLKDPTENAVAQAQWAIEKVSGLTIPEHALQVPRNYETSALRNRVLSDWDDVIDNCWSWADYEPTSSRPMVMGSFVASTVYGNSTLALQFVDRGLQTEPNEFSLLNNRAVALAELGRMEEAFASLGRIAVEGIKESHRPVLLATTGLLRFRSGDVEGGRALYEQALSHPAFRGDLRRRSLALLFLAQEEARAHSTAIATALARASEAVKKASMPELVPLMKRVRDMVADAK